MRRFVYYWLPVILWAVLIFIMSSQRSIKTSEIKLLDFIIHKIAHIVEYSIFSILFYRAKRNWKIALLATIIYASTDEIHQLFVSTREGRFRDVVIDSLGGLFGIWIANFILRIRHRKQKKLV